MPKDPLIDNKYFYNFHYYLLHYFGMILRIMLVLYIVGILNAEPAVVLTVNTIIKVTLACFLIYRFNSFRKYEIRFTELDKKIIFASGVYILATTFTDYVEMFKEELRDFVVGTIVRIEKFYLHNIIKSSGVTASSQVSIIDVVDETRNLVING